MSDDEELDLKLRDRFRALYGEPELPLGDDAKQRVLEHVVKARALARFANAAQRGAWAVGCLAAAASVVLIVRGALAPHAERAVTPVCSLPNAAAGAMPHFERLPDGRQALALGRFGRVFADPHAEVQIERASACELTLRLGSGRLAADLQKLAPASLHVQTALGEIVVRGTRFSVHTDGALEVVLLSGKVDVLAPDHSPVQLAPGKVLTKTAQHIELADVRPEHARELAQLLTGDGASDAAAPPPAPPPLATNDAGVPRADATRGGAKRSTAELLAAAEAERKKARLAEARALYREAGARDDENAEVALLRWAGLELDAGDAHGARNVLGLHRRRFPNSRLRVEALWLDVRIEEALGASESARTAARELIGTFPNTPQAAAARRLFPKP